MVVTRSNYRRRFAERLESIVHEELCGALIAYGNRFIVVFILAHFCVDTREYDECHAAVHASDGRIGINPEFFRERK